MDSDERVSPCGYVCVFVFCSSDNVPIVELRSGQSLKLRCRARKGTGKEHARFSPVCTAAMKFVPSVKLNPQAVSELSNAQRRELAACCPRRVFNYDESTQQLDVFDEKECIFCQACVIKAKEDFRRSDLVTVRDQSNGDDRRNVNFSVEVFLLSNSHLLFFLSYFSCFSLLFFFRKKTCLDIEDFALIFHSRCFLE